MEFQKGDIVVCARTADLSSIYDYLVGQTATVVDHSDGKLRVSWINDTEVLGVLVSYYGSSEDLNPIDDSGGWIPELFDFYGKKEELSIEIKDRFDLMMED